MSRRQDVLEARVAADAWAAERNLPASGGYSGRWYIDGYLSGWWPADWLQWLATYDGNPGSQLGGDVVGHQYSSTPVDQSVFVESEFVDAGDPDVPDDELKACEDKVAGLVNALGYIGGDVLKPLTRKNAAAYVKTAVAQIRAVLDQYGIEHA